MANTINMELKLQSSGIKEANKDAQDLNKNLKAAIDTASRVSGTAGSRAVSAAAAPKQSAMAAKEENTGYNVQRAVGGSTGSATSDFARQASGLGGLVHVYATFAANIFAASAAFNMLSKAMDTSNLVKGLDQIGAATGRNLGSVAKQMVAAADGAISLRDAMSSTAMASSAGMTNQAIIRMTAVAQKASLALGRDMSDSMDRLTKGIAKVQPELLDELGIMTRVIPAQQEYARQIGKTAATLTDFEKRQAFANAVLSEGERKFGSINLDSNPYSKLSASITNLLQDGANVLNKVLGPLVSMLASSPVGLVTALGGIGSILFKQAIPAISAWRENLAAAAKEAAANAKRVNDAFTDNDVAKKMSTAFQKANPFKKLADDARTGAQEVLAGVFGEKSAIMKSISSSTSDPTIAAKMLDTEIKKSQTIKDRLVSMRATEAQQATADKAHLLALDEEIAKLDNKISKSKIASALKKSETENMDKHNAILDTAVDEAGAKNPLFSKAWFLQQASIRATSKETSKSILSDIGQMTKSVSMGDAFKALNAGIVANSASLTTMGKVFTYVGGTAIIMGEAIATAMNVAFAAVAAVGLAIAFLDSRVTNSAKESERFREAIDTLNSSLDNVDRTLEAINKKGSEGFLSVESLQAKATALDDLTASLSSAVGKFSKLQEAQNGWDKFFDGMWDFVGKGSGDKLALGISSSVIDALKLMEEGPAKEQAKKSIESIIGQKVDFSGVKEFNASIKDLDTTRITEIGKDTSKMFNEVSRSASNAAASGTELKAAYVESEKAFQTFINSTKDTSHLSVLGESIITDAEKLTAALKNPTQALLAMNDIVSSPTKLSLFPRETSEQLIQFTAKLKTLTAEQQNAVQTMGLLDASIAKLEVEKNKSFRRVEFSTELSSIGEDASANIQDIQAKLQEALKNKAALQIDIDTRLNPDVSRIKAVFEQAVASQAQLGANIVVTKLNESWAKANATIGSTIAGLLGDTSAGIILRAQYEKQALAAQEATLKVQLNLIKSNEELAVQTGLTRISMERQRLSGPLQDSSLLKLLDEEEKGYKYRLEHTKGDIKQGDTNKVVADKVNNVAGAKETFQYLQAQEATVAAIAGVRANSAAIDTKSTVELMLLKRKQYAENKVFELESMKLSQDKLALVEKASGVGSVSLLQVQQEVALKIASADAEAKIYNLQTETDKLLLLKNKQSGSDAAKTQVSINENEAQISKTKLGLTESINKLKLQHTLEEISKIEAVRLDTQARQVAADLVDYNIATDKRDLAMSELEYQKLILATTDESYVKQKSILEVANLIAAAKEKEATISREGNDKVSQIQSNIDQQYAIVNNAKDRNSVEVQAAWGEIIRQSGLVFDLKNNTSKEIGALKQVLDQKVAITQKQAEYNALVAKQTDQMNTLVDITASLAAVFGEVGDNIGKAGEAMLKLSQNAELRAKAEAGKSGEDLESLRKKHAQAELKDIATLAAAGKKAANEKTNLGRAFAAVEKGAQLEKLSLAAKEEVFNEQNLKKLSTGIDEWMKKAQDGTLVDGIASVVRQGVAGDPWTAIPRMIAMASFVSSLTGQSVEGPPPIDQGTMAGTGQQVGPDGQTIGTRAGGVLGDPKAQAKSITDSIDNLSKVFFGNMGSSSSALITHLKGIQDNTYSTAKALGAAGTIGSGNPFGAASGDSKAFSTGIGLLDNVLGSIFGGNTSQSVTGSGIRGSGTATDLARNASGIQGYTNIHRETSGGWFSSGSSSDTTQMTKLDNSITKGLQGIFTNFNDVLLDTAKGLGKSRTDIQNILDTTKIDLNVSNAGLTGTEFAQKLSAEVSIQLNSIAEKAYPFLSLYTKVGEESFQTATRLIKDSETVTFGLNMVGKAITGITDTQAKIAVQQKIIDNFGGTADEFASAIQAYYDALFTDSEKAITSFSNISIQLANLGIAGVGTNKQLKDLIASTSETDPLYASLVKLVPAFTDMTAAAQKLQDAMGSLQDQAYGLIASTISTSQTEKDAAVKAAKDLKREALRKSIDPSLKSRQEYVFALEDLKAAEDELAAARKKNLSITKKTADDQISTLKSTISSMDNFITSLSNFKDSLLLGAQSILNPGDKYTEASKQFSDILATATSAAITPEQQKAKDEALGQIQNSATAFLEASRIYNASSSQYTTDFNLVQNALTNTTSTLKTQKSTAETTLDTLITQSDLMQAQLDALDNITNAILDTSGMERDILSLKNSVTTTGIAASAETAAQARTKAEAEVYAQSIANQKKADDLVVYATNLIKSLDTTSSAAITTLLSQMTSTNGGTNGGTDGGSSNFKADMSAESVAFFNFLDSEAGKIFKDIRGEALSKAIAESLPTLFGASLPVSLLARAGMEMVGFTKADTLTVGEADALAKVAQESPTLLQAIKDAKDAGIDIKTLVSDMALNMKVEAANTSMLGDVLGNGKGNMDAAARTVENTIDALKIQTAVANDNTAAAQATAQAAAAAAQAATAVADPSSPYYGSSTSSYWAQQAAQDTGSTYQGMYTPSTQSEGYSYAMNYSSYGSYADGGLASGLSMVGENGPEFVDFKTPGRVYTAEETYGMFNGTNGNMANAVAQMTKEIASLKAEVVQLRKDQQAQTGDIIMSNYDANNRNASAVVNATTEATKATNWANRQVINVV